MAGVAAMGWQRTGSQSRALRCAVPALPQHVILNHIYLQRTTSSVNATVLGTTHR